MKVALRAIHEWLAGDGDPAARWRRLVVSFARHTRADGVLGERELRAILDSEAITAPPAAWAANLRGLGVLDEKGRVVYEQADAVATALALVGDSFSTTRASSVWVPVITMPDRLRPLLHPPVMRQTAGVLLDLMDQAQVEVLIAAPFVDRTAIAFLLPSLISCGRRGVELHIVTSVGSGESFHELVEAWPKEENAKLIVTEIAGGFSSLGSHAKVVPGCNPVGVDGIRLGPSRPGSLQLESLSVASASPACAVRSHLEV